jgi:hypothetical protein
VASVVRFFGARNDEFADGVRRVRRDTPYRRKLVPRDSCPRGPGGDRTALSEGFRPRRHRRPTNSYLVGLHLCCGLLTCTDTALAAPSWPRFLGDPSGTAAVDPLTTPSLRTVRDALTHGIEWSLDKLSAPKFRERHPGAVALRTTPPSRCLPARGSRLLPGERHHRRVGDRPHPSTASQAPGRRPSCAASLAPRGGLRCEQQPPSANADSNGDGEAVCDPVHLERWLGSHLAEEPRGHWWLRTCSHRVERGAVSPERLNTPLSARPAKELGAQQPVGSTPGCHLPERSDEFGFTVGINCRADLGHDLCSHWSHLQVPI